MVENFMCKNKTNIDSQLLLIIPEPNVCLGKIFGQLDKKRI